MRLVSACLCVAVSVPLGTAADFPGFSERVIDANVGKVCYAVITADVNGDGQRDIVGLTENRVIWYENPSWQAHVILEDQTPADNVCIAAHDIDGDGRVDFAIGAGWTKIGTLHWISRSDNPDDRWNVFRIGEERATHRMRFADVLGTGQPQLVVSPLLASIGNGARLLAFRIPQNPRTDRWPQTVLNDQMNRMHNHWHVDLNKDTQTDTLTASREGVHWVRRSGDEYSAIQLSAGAAADEPDQNGAGEIRHGQLDGRTFLTTVEPMHGHSVAVYTPSKDKGVAGPWQRHVIDSGFKRGHALWATDMNADGSDEIIFGHSDTPDTFGVIVYTCSNNDPATWVRHVIDAGGMATEDLLVEDLTGDGRPDIVAGGRATHNIKLYVQD